MLFGEISIKNAVSWTTLLAGNTHQGDGYGALWVFRQMLQVCAFSVPIVSVFLHLEDIFRLQNKKQAVYTGPPYLENLNMLTID